MNIIGVAGLPRSGKDTLAEILMENGYFGVSLGDIVRDESKKRHADDPQPISVKNMTETSNYLRTKHGADFALKEALTRYEKAKQTTEYIGLVVFSVRAPVEADFILKNSGKLIWVDASDEVRNQRANSNLREGEAELSVEEMKAQEVLQEKPQPGLPKEVQMDTSYVKSQASIVIENNGNSLEDFVNNAKQVLEIS
ncbi:AAA family ATPase [Candidatus Saccharibacteria bacterium]|nr:AAA family ATPase [Candidatus Saccharibacteria bacterium]